MLRGGEAGGLRVQGSVRQRTIVNLLVADEVAIAPGLVVLDGAAGVLRDETGVACEDFDHEEEAELCEN